MKLDFEETENKIEIEKAELLKKNKEQDMVINSQAIIAKELRDEGVVPAKERPGAN